MSDTHSFEADELVSAYIDGALTPEEAAQVESDAALLARVAELQAAARAVAAAVPSPPPATRQAAIARAVAEAAPVLPTHTEAPDNDEPPPIRSSRWPHARDRRALSIAAAVLLLLIGAPLLARLMTDGDDGDLTAAKLPTTLSSPRSTDSGAGQSAESGSLAPTPRAAGLAAEGAHDLGRLDSPDELVERVRSFLEREDAGGSADASSLAGPDRRAAEPEAGAAGCDDRLRRAERSLGPVVWVGEAVYRGAFVQVFVFAPAEGQQARTLIAAAPGEACSTVARRQL